MTSEPISSPMSSTTCSVYTRSIEHSTIYLPLLLKIMVNVSQMCRNKRIRLSFLHTRKCYFLLAGNVESVVWRAQVGEARRVGRVGGGGCRASGDSGRSPSRRISGTNEWVGSSRHRAQRH